jgi:Lon protease-like protein
MFELPLFPLNTVLFPGMPLALHIFEDRYKLMIGKCVQEQRPFGVVLIKQGAEAMGPLAEPHLVGCAAKITQVKRLEQGRLNIAVVGQDRFRISSLDDRLPYLVGQVERYPLTEGDPAVQAVEAERLRPWVLRYLDLLPQADDIDLQKDQLPEEAGVLAYLAATVLQMPPEQKQPFLAAERTIGLLAALRKTYRREVALMKQMIEQPLVDQGSFSLN